MPAAQTRRKAWPRRRSPDRVARKRAARLVLAAYAADNQEIRAAVRQSAAGGSKGLVGVLWLLTGIVARMLHNPTPEQADAEIRLVVGDLAGDR